MTGRWVLTFCGLASIQCNCHHKIAFNNFLIDGPMVINKRALRLEDGTAMTRVVRCFRYLITEYDATAAADAAASDTTTPSGGT